MTPASPSPLARAVGSALAEALSSRGGEAGAEGGSEADPCVPPAALLWTDPSREFEEAASELLSLVPRLFVLGDYEHPEDGGPPRRGPAIWLRCRVDEEGEPPVLYLPGIARDQLRAVEEQPWALAPLSELRHRGAFFCRPDGKDWSLGALFLDRDPAGALLSFLNAPDRALSRWSAVDRDALRILCREAYGFDPARDRSLREAALLLSRHEGRWTEAWERFSGDPASFPGIVALLERSEPSDHGAGYLEASWPGANRRQEEVLRSDLAALSELPAPSARGLVAGLTAVHRQRSEWVWARLGQSPLACALPDLSRLARATGRTGTGGDAAALAAAWAESGGKVEAILLDVLAAVDDPESPSGALIHRVAATFYGAWLQEGERRLSAAGPALVPASSPEALLDTISPGECLLFAPGLRLDLADRLAKGLWAAGLVVETAWRFGAAAGSSARGSGVDHALLPGRGFQSLLDEALGAPRGRAFAEYPFLGDVEPLLRKGARAVASEAESALAALGERVRALVGAGWRRVVVTTDRGWLLLPRTLAAPAGETLPERVVPLLVVTLPPAPAPSTASTSAPPTPAT